MNSSDFASKKLKGRDVSAAPRIIYKNVQSGRSMIEMLGVLAIIGVLSVGGIAGYSKAMMKYRTNKTIEQITLIAGNLRTFFGNQPPAHRYCSLNGESDIEKIIKKAKLVPDEVLNSSTITGSDYSRNFFLTSAFGGPIVIGSKAYFGNRSSDADKFAVITYTSIPQQACIDIAAQDWSDLNPEAVCINKVEFDIDNPEMNDCSGFITDVEDAINKCDKEYNDITFIIK